ncbi:TSCPD domain-containing protein, partial [Candidatus Bathyarchaeota archaeon]|nr:TSCPD domain-containing protein [Candidatus Bathyarchaeota archaeon]
MPATGWLGEDKEATIAKIPRPRVLGGITVKKMTGCGNMYVQMNWYHGRLFEVFATIGHSGGCAMSFTEALTRSITAGLRQETPVPVEEYIDQLHDIRCLNPFPFPKEEATLSCPDAIAKAL